MLSSSRKLVIMYCMSQSTSARTRTATTSPSCATGTRSNLAPLSSPSPKPPQAKTHGEWSLLLFVDCYDALPLRTLPRSRFAVTNHNNLPRNVTHQPLSCIVFVPAWCSMAFDFIGGDFNMSALSTVGDVFSDPEFAAPANSLLRGLGGLDETCRECTGFFNMPRHLRTWRVHPHGCYKFDNADMCFGPRDLAAHYLAFLHLRVTNLPGPDSIIRSDQAHQRRMEKAVGRYERKRLRKRLGQHIIRTLQRACPLARCP